MDGNDVVPIRTLLLTVFESITEVFLLCMAGYILSRVGVTDKATQRKLNVINVSLFTPALLFSKVAFSLTPAKLKEMWTIPVGFLIVTGLSAGVAWSLSRAFKLSRSQRAFAICAAMFQNSNSLPIALIQSLVLEVPHLKWDADDTKDQMLGRALTYLVLYSTLGMMLRWSVGVRLLSKADEEQPTIESSIPHPPHPHSHSNVPVISPEVMEPNPGARETDPYFTTQKGLTQDEEDEEFARTTWRGSARQSSSGTRDVSPSPASAWIPDPSSALSVHALRPPTTGRPSGSRRNSQDLPQRKQPTRTESGRQFWGLPEAPRRQRTYLSQELSDDGSEEEEEEEEEWGPSTPGSLRRRAARPPTSRLRATLRSIGIRMRKALKSVHDFMTVPMYAALLSILIAMIPPLQYRLGKVKPFEQAIRSAGQCSIPVTLVVLGAFFYKPPESQPIALPIHEDEHSPSQASDGSLGGYFERKLRAFRGRHRASDAYPGENKAVFVAVMSRMIIVPLIMMPFLALIAKYDLFEAAEDPVFILSAVLLVSSPPALTLAQITQAASGDAFERLISKTITWSYAVLTPPLTLFYVVLGLVFGRL